MKKLRSIKNPFILFLPFLLIYAVLVVIFPTDGKSGDQTRYLLLSHHLLHGFFSPPPPAIDLGNGPGYPILLMPFLALKLPLLFITLMNAVLYYLSVVFLFKSLRKLASENLSILISIIWGCFFNLYELIPSILTETLTVFLVSALTYSLFNVFSNDRKKSVKAIVVSGFLLGYLALTKPIFGYVIMVLILGIAILLITKRKSINYRRTFALLLVAFLTTLPYLFYTYQLTNKLFYWGSNAGNNLYWMSTTYEDEYGSWIAFPPNWEDQLNEETHQLIISRHKNDFGKALQYKGVRQDSILKEIAIKNIKAHPFKFLQNCLSNAGRIIFNFPYSYKQQSPNTLLRIPFNGIIVLAALFCLIPTLLNWRKIPFTIKFLLFLTLLYLGGSLLGSAETRMFTVIVPILLIWIAYVIQRTIRINLKMEIEKT